MRLEVVRTNARRGYSVIELDVGRLVRCRGDC